MSLHANVRMRQQELEHRIGITKENAKTTGICQKTLLVMLYIPPGDIVRRADQILPQVLP